MTNDHWWADRDIVEMLKYHDSVCMNVGVVMRCGVYNGLRFRVDGRQGIGYMMMTLILAMTMTLGGNVALAAGLACCGIWIFGRRGR